MKRAILVLGPESSGNRLVVQILIAAGCYGDSTTGRQRLDDTVPSESQDVVWMRSVPHGGAWPNIASMVERVRAADRLVQAVVCLRDPYCTERSQVAAGHVHTLKQAQHQRGAAIDWILNGLSRAEVPWSLIIYEAIILHPKECIRALFRRLNLPAVDFAEAIYDGNAKWYGEQT